MRWFDDVSITGSESVCGCVFRFVAMCLSKDKWKSISHLSCSMKMQRKYDTWHIVGINGFDTGPTAGIVYLCIHVCRLRNGDLLMLIRLHLIFLYFFPHFIKWHFDWTWCLNTVHDSRTRLSRITFRCVCVCAVCLDFNLVLHGMAREYWAAHSYTLPAVHIQKWTIESKSKSRKNEWHENQLNWTKSLVIVNI